MVDLWAAIPGGTAQYFLLDRHRRPYTSRWCGQIVRLFFVSSSQNIPIVYKVSCYLLFWWRKHRCSYIRSIYLKTSTWKIFYSPARARINFISSTFLSSPNTFIVLRCCVISFWHSLRVTVRPWPQPPVSSIMNENEQDAMKRGTVREKL